MKQQRKDELLHSFPCVPQSIMDQMKGRLAANFAVFLTDGNELFVRCYHRYSDGKLFERQRYVFAKDGSVRWGKDDGARGRFARNSENRYSARAATATTSTTPTRV